MCNQIYEDLKENRKNYITEIKMIVESCTGINTRHLCSDQMPEDIKH